MPYIEVILQQHATRLDFSSLFLLTLLQCEEISGRHYSICVSSLSQTESLRELDNSSACLRLPAAIMAGECIASPGWQNCPLREVRNLCRDRTRCSAAGSYAYDVRMIHASTVPRGKYTYGHVDAATESCRTFEYNSTSHSLVHAANVGDNSHLFDHYS